jgi:hypothetical protein
MRWIVRLGGLLCVGVLMAGCAAGFNSRLRETLAPSERADDPYYKRALTPFPSDCEWEHGRKAEECKVPPPAATDPR